MSQSRTVSLIETIVNVAIGFLVSLFLWPAIAHVVEIEYTTSQHYWVVCLFTVTSVVRAYVVRRFFNSHVHKISETIATRLDNFNTIKTGG